MISINVLWALPLAAFSADCIHRVVRIRRHFIDDDIAPVLTFLVISLFLASSVFLLAVAIWGVLG